MKEIKGHEIVYVNYGISNIIGNKIYVHKALKDYPRLQMLVLKHELRHINNEDHVDLKEPWNWNIAIFCLTHPST